MQCPICLDVSSTFVSLVCNDSAVCHDMCIECFEVHTETDNTCPQCRTPHDPRELADALVRARSGTGRVVLIADEPYQGPAGEVDMLEVQEEALALQAETDQMIRVSNALTLVTQVIQAVMNHEPIELTNGDLDGIDHETFFTEMARFQEQVDEHVRQAESRDASRYSRRVSTALQVFLGTLPVQ